jgi:pimeloyl-ACP methyl ester carboxylesterase
VFRPATLSLFLAGLVTPATLALQERAGENPVRKAPWPGTASAVGPHLRYDFECEQRRCFVIQPQHAAPGRPWVWRARFPSYHDEADQLLLDRGFHVAYLNTDGMLGSPRSMELWDRFYHDLSRRGLSPRPALEGVSRGGLFAYAFAARFPERVACIYADTPVCDIKSWPGGFGRGLGHAPTWQRLLKEYELDELSARSYPRNPIDQLRPLAAAGIPLLHLISPNDQVVPAEENTGILATRYRALGGSIEVLAVEAGTEESRGHHFPHPDPGYVADFMERNAANLPDPDDYFVLRGSLSRSLQRLQSGPEARVAFLGGSITANPGWREQIMAYLRQKFPQTSFDFMNAGIPSMGSVPGAFRLARDVFSAGRVDLLFVEAAVNDSSNGRSERAMLRGMEGIVRQARRQQPALDLVLLHFVDPAKLSDYRSGTVPEVIRCHEAVAQHYSIPSVHLAREVTERIDAGQFGWNEDFQDLHPSAFGQRLYAASLRRLLSCAWRQSPAEPLASPVHPLPEQLLDPFSYDRARSPGLEVAHNLQGFELLRSVDPRADGVGGAVRSGFFQVPMLVATEVGATFHLSFSGRAAGLLVTAGPDAGQVEYRVDRGSWRTQDLFTRWSQGLHLPWAYVLADELHAGPHVLEVRIGPDRNPGSQGHACRIVQLMVNE